MCLLGKETHLHCPHYVGCLVGHSLSFVARFWFSLMVMYLSLFFSLEDRPILFIWFLWSSSCHLVPLPFDRPSPAVPVPPHRDCLPCAQQSGGMCQPCFLLASIRQEGEWEEWGRCGGCGTALPVSFTMEPPAVTASPTLSPRKTELHWRAARPWPWPGSEEKRNTLRTGHLIIQLHLWKLAGLS